MLAEHRYNYILQRVNQLGSVSIKQLSDTLKVSRETIRRDITQLAQDNRVRQIRGGAMSFTFLEPDFSERVNVSAEGKRHIAILAASLVPDGASVLLDSGTTTQAVAEELMKRERLTIYTNDVQICLRLGRVDGNIVHLLGGRLEGHDDALTGWDTVAMLERYYADFAFIGAGAVSAEPALMDYSRDGGELRGRMLLSAKSVVIVADHKKMGTVAAVRVPNFDRATHLITDMALSEDMDKALSSTAIEVLIAAHELKD